MPKRHLKPATQFAMPRETAKHNTNLVPDVDAGRISNVPRYLVGDKPPADTYVSKPFYFGGSNVRAFYKVDN